MCCMMGFGLLWEYEGWKCGKLVRQENILPKCTQRGMVVQ
jgi:hypothetical protein